MIEIDLRDRARIQTNTNMNWTLLAGRGSHLHLCAAGPSAAEMDGRTNDQLTADARHLTRAPSASRPSGRRRRRLSSCWPARATAPALCRIDVQAELVKLRLAALAGTQASGRTAGRAAGGGGGGSRDKVEEVVNLARHSRRRRTWRRVVSPAPCTQFPPPPLLLFAARQRRTQSVSIKASSSGPSHLGAVLQLLEPAARSDALGRLNRSRGLCRVSPTGLMRPRRRLAGDLCARPS
jgi:hypothetical protein